MKSVSLWVFAVLVVGLVIKVSKDQRVMRDCQENQARAVTSASRMDVSEVAQTPVQTHEDPRTVPTPATTDHFKEVVSREDFDRLFPRRHPLYTYEGLLAAAKDFRAFGGVGSLSMRKREAAAFFANVAHNTDKLKHVREVDPVDTCCDVDKRDVAICARGKKYYMRGPGMLSGSINYRRASFYLFGDSRLSQNPDLVEQDPVVVWKTALWFWFEPPPTPGFSAHDSVASEFAHTLGFGGTVNGFTWGWDCQPSMRDSLGRRVGYFLDFARMLKTQPIGPNECRHQT